MRRASASKKTSRRSASSAEAPALLDASTFPEDLLAPDRPGAHHRVPVCAERPFERAAAVEALLEGYVVEDRTARWDRERAAAAWDRSPRAMSVAEATFWLHAAALLADSQLTTPEALRDALVALGASEEPLVAPESAPEPARRGVPWALQIAALRRLYGLRAAFTRALQWASYLLPTVFVLEDPAQAFTCLAPYADPTPEDDEEERDLDAWARTLIAAQRDDGAIARRLEALLAAVRVGAQEELAYLLQAPLRYVHTLGVTPETYCKQLAFAAFYLAEDPALAVSTAFRYREEASPYPVVSRIARFLVARDAYSLFASWSSKLVQQYADDLHCVVTPGVAPALWKLAQRDPEHDDRVADARAWLASHPAHALAGLAPLLAAAEPEEPLVATVRALASAHPAAYKHTLASLSPAKRKRVVACVGTDD